MTDSELVKWLQFSSNKSILIVNGHNLLQELLCPFKVLVIANIGALVMGQIVFVVEIKVTKDLVIVYIIGDKAYFYYHFEIISQ